jgi:hypothetical protein
VTGSDGVDGALRPGALQLVVDDELVEGISVQSPRPGPVGDDVPGVRELAPSGVGMFGQPGSNLEPSRIILGRELEIQFLTPPQKPG